MWKIKQNCIQDKFFICSYCGNYLKKVTWKEIYQTDKYPWFYWKCISCVDTYVWCHKWTAIPLGSVANKELRKLRNETHLHFDKLWKEQWKWRKNSYNWLSQKLWIPFNDCHIAMFDIEKCKKTILLLNHETPPI